MFAIVCDCLGRRVAARLCFSFSALGDKHDCCCRTLWNCRITFDTDRLCGQHAMAVLALPFKYLFGNGRYIGGIWHLGAHGNLDRTGTQRAAERRTDDVEAWGTNTGLI